MGIEFGFMLGVVVGAAVFKSLLHINSTGDSDDST